MDDLDLYRSCGGCGAGAFEEHDRECTRVVHLTSPLLDRIVLAAGGALALLAAFGGAELLGVLL